MTSDDEWVKLELLGPDWVFVNLVGDEENHEDGGEGPDDSGDADAPNPHYELVHKEEPDVNEDGNEDQNMQRFQNDREIIQERDIDEGAYVFCTSNESALGFHHEIDVESGTHGFSEGACEGNSNKVEPRLSDDALAHGRSENAFKGDEDAGANGFSHSEIAHGFLQAELCEGDDKVAHVVSHEKVFLCEDKDDEDAQDAESAQGFPEDTCKEVEEEEEEEEEENDEYIDALHEGALQDESSKDTSYLIDAVERYHMNPVTECLQEYICSVQTETRRELHETKMESFRGYGPQPRPFIEDSKCFNPLFEGMWLPWAINAEYCHNEDMGLLVWDGDTGSTQCTLAAQHYMSSAVPILPVLEYMVNRTPSKKIAHIGSCSSLYWAALLQQLGAANVIVTEGSYPVTCSPAGYPHIKQIEEEMFFMLNMAVGRALFFLRPSKRSSDTEPCMAERFLFCFPGDTIFFIGEYGKHTDDFNMAQWVEEHALEGWHVEKEMEIPCWPGSHDVFLCITKASLPVDIITT